MDNERKDEDTFNDDDLFDGLSNEDYTPESTVEEDSDDDLDNSGYVHDTFDNEEELYNYQEDEEGDSAYGVDSSATKAGGGLLAQFKHKLTQGSVSDRLRALVIPLFVVMLVVGYCGYKIMELLAPAPVAVQQQETGLDVRKYIERPKPPSDELQQEQLSGVRTEPHAQTAPGASGGQPVKSQQPATQAGQHLATTKPVVDIPSQTATVAGQQQSGQVNQLVDQMAHSPVPASNPSKADINQLMGVENERSPDLIAKPVQHTQTDKTASQVAHSQSKTEEASIATLKATVAKLSKARMGDQEKIAQLTKQLTEANQHLSRLSQELKGSLAQLQTQIAALKKTRKEQQHVVSLTKQASQDYTVQAMIPGRAWLKDRAGKIMTISRGQLLPGYGSVLKIDTESGVIIMSSGAVLSYALGH